jgi:hypothetical protein
MYFNTPAKEINMEKQPSHIVNVASAENQDNLLA